MSILPIKLLNCQKEAYKTSNIFQFVPYAPLPHEGEK
jgi:hypothetical protein